MSTVGSHLGSQSTSLASKYSKELIAATIALLSVLAQGDVANAEQFSTHTFGREVVVHTRAIPVIMHRLVPPNYGRHITLREYQTGQVPNATLANQPARQNVLLSRVSVRLFQP